MAGAAAMFCQVGALMWMRTTVNFQYAKGMGTLEALRHLYKEVRLAAAAASSSHSLPSPRRLPLPLCRALGSRQPLIHLLAALRGGGGWE